MKRETKLMILIIVFSFLGGVGGSFIISILKPTDTFATQHRKEIAVHKILFFDEEGNLRGEIKGYKGGLSLLHILIYIIKIVTCCRVTTSLSLFGILFCM